MRYALLLIFLFVCPQVWGQTNLVRNPGFEQYTSCPNNNDESYLCYGWNSLDSTWTIDSFPLPDCYPDYVNGCAIPILGVSFPKGQDYYQYPHSGHGMMHMRFYDDGVFEPGRVTYDYLQGRLYRPLDSGRTYCVSFYASLCKWSPFAVNDIGAYLDDGSIDTTTDCGRPKNYVTPQLNDTSILSDTATWTLVRGSFTANGSERFITIGDFFDTTQTAKIVNYSVVGHSTALGWGMYLIDDVSVIAIDDTANAGPDAVTTPMGDSVWVGDTTGYLPCYWYANGVLIDSNKAGFKVLPDTTTTYVLMLDVCGNITYDSATVYVFPTGMGAVMPMHVLLYPNPASTSVTLEGARGCALTLVDAVGQTVWSLPEAGMKQVVPLEGLLPGVYTLVAANAVTGERTCRMVEKR